MRRNCDEDSGRSSCSAGSFGISPIVELETVEMRIVSDELKTKLHSVTREASTNTELRVSTRPRSCVGLPKSPDERDPFPSYKISTSRSNTLQHLFDSPRNGVLSNAHSTLEIASSTRIEQPRSLPQNSASLSNVDTGSQKDNVRGLFKRGKPVQRAASRLYRAEPAVKGQNKCVGPEFIVRASQPVQRLDLTTADVDKKIVTIILLTGQRIEVVCEPNNTTAGHIFQAIIQHEKYEHNFMLGMAVLIGGDFVFLPDDYKIRKVSPEGWCPTTKSSRRLKEIKPFPAFTAFLRIKFFLPTNIAKNIQGGEWRHRVYLQLRRSTVEGQLISSLQNLIILAGYALHIEFGDFFYREHGTGDYFLVEHYLPEGCYSADITDIKLRMKRAHETRRGMDRDKAIINYIALAQTYRDYGAHFYSAVWATRDGFCRDIWLSIAPRGVTIYSRNSCISALPKESHCGNMNNRIVLQSLAWHHIHTLHFNKKTLYIIPNARSGLSKTSIKYKIKMEDNKSYFTYWLASLHHNLYIKLHAKQDFIDYLSDELSYPVSPTSSGSRNHNSSECSNYQDSYNLAVRNQPKIKRQVKKRFRMDIFPSRNSVVTLNKENEKPDTQKQLQELLAARLNDRSIFDESINSVNSKPNCSSNEGLSSSESCSLPRRQGVKMGIRAFHGMRTNRSATVNGKSCLLRSEGDLAATQSDSDDFSLEPKNHCDVNSMKLLPQRSYNCDEPAQSYPQTAYVIESPKVYTSFAYNPTNDETCLNTSLFEKLDSSSCIQGERCFVTAVLRRDNTGALGMQVAEGSDGNVYIKSITTNGPADFSKKLIPGDQIISVNGQTLLNMQYNKALSMLQSAPLRVELIVLQNLNRTQVMNNGSGCSQFGLEGKPNFMTTQMSADSVAGGINELGTDGDKQIINEEALRTIQALIKLTKQNVIMRMKEKSNMSTPNKMLLQKCLSENKIYDESDTGNCSSQESTPQKRPSQHFDTWRCKVQNRPKRRPLSLHIPPNVELSDKYFSNYEDEVSLNNAAVLEKASMNKVQSSLQSLGEKLIDDVESKSVAVPRNFGLSRKWLGPVKYPVTPCKQNSETQSQIVPPKETIKKHFVYGSLGNDQIFL